MVSPAYDLVNMFPRRLNFVRAGLVSIVVGVFFAPWLWMHDSATIFAVLGYIVCRARLHRRRVGAGRRDYARRLLPDPPPQLRPGQLPSTPGRASTSTAAVETESAGSHRPRPPRRLRTPARPGLSGLPLRLHLVPRPRLAVSAVAYAIAMSKESPEIAEPAMEIAEDLRKDRPAEASRGPPGDPGRSSFGGFARLLTEL